MADNAEAKARRERIEVEERHWATVHCGTREALITAGLARPEQFPGEPGCGKTSTVFPAAGAERKKQIRRRSTYLYEVAFYKTGEETAAYMAAFQAESAAAQEKLRTEEERRYAEAGRRLKRAALADGGPRGMAMAAMAGAAVSLAMAFNIKDDPDRPYGFPAETKAAVRDHLDRIMELFKHGGFEPRLGAVAAGDPEFQRFMQRAAPGNSGSDAR